MSGGSLRERGGVVDALSSALDRGGHGIASAPALLRRVLTEESWREFETQRGELVRHARFADFVTTPPLKGLGTNVDLVGRIISDDHELDRLLRIALKEKPGPRSHDNITRTETGTSRSYADDRLARDAPELYSQVLAGHLSAHAAMVQAGFRRRTISVAIEDPERVVAALRTHMNPDQLAEVVRRLTSS